MMNNPLIKINPMNTKHISLAFAAAAALLAGCTKNSIEESGVIEAPDNSGGLTDLELAYVGAIESKAAIDGTDFPQTGEIGLFLFKDELADTPYGESGYSNVRYAYNSTKSKWTASPSIKVGSDPGYLFGYYPYSSTATDVKEIPVASSLNGDDVMYATKQTVNDNTASQTAITMNHALARVSITVINNGYTGKAELSKIKFSGAEIAQGGTLNAIDGKITATKTDDVTLDVIGEAQTITAAGTTYECLLVPSGEDDNKQTITLTLTIDGIDKTATLSEDNGVIIAQNTKSNITITLSNKEISIQTVSVEDWNDVEVGGHKVSVKLSDDTPADEVMFSASVEGQSVKIIAYPANSRGLICNISGTASCDRNRNFKDVHTFTISEIQTDITATIEYSPLPQGALNRVFTVYQDEKNGIAKKIHFSQGNLYYDGSNWGFEQEQYYFRTYSGYGKCDASGYDKDEGTADGHWGLFGWSTSDTYGKNISNIPTDYLGNFYDWGNAIDGSIWRTLTIDEWQYLFDHHTIVWSTCNLVPGHFIAPDGFVGGESALSSIISDWGTAKSAGIVFLPAAGTRDGFPTGSNVLDVGFIGDYWSSSSNSDKTASIVGFGEIGVMYGLNTTRFIGCSVRLVTEVK